MTGKPLIVLISAVLVSSSAAQTGARVYGQWPGLEPEQLDQGRDLALTTDFRTVLTELVTRHLGATNTEAISPGFQPSVPLGLL